MKQESSDFQTKALEPWSNFSKGLDQLGESVYKSSASTVFSPPADLRTLLLITPSPLTIHFSHFTSRILQSHISPGYKITSGTANKGMVTNFLCILFHSSYKFLAQLQASAICVIT